jgi:hypothetical protein
MIHEPAQSVSVSLDLLASNLAAPPADQTLESNAPIVGSQRNAKVSQVAYTSEQLEFLQGHLNEFSKKAQSRIRGDAKKYALDVASELLERYGQPNLIEDEINLMNG